MEPEKEKMTPETHPTVTRIIEELRDDPEARILLLRTLLTEEFLAMPVRMERVEAGQARLEKDVAELKASQARMEASLGNIEGWHLEMQFHRSITSLASKTLSLRRPEMMQSIAQQTEPELQDAVGDAYHAGIIDRKEEERISRTDIIVRARRREGNAPLWLAVEVSRTIRARDIERAVLSAEILQKVTGEEAVPVTAGTNIRQEDRDRAHAAGVTVLHAVPPEPED